VVVLNLGPVSEAYKLMFVIPRIALDSSMACLVFRGLKLGLIEDINYSVQSKSIRFVHNRPSMSGGHSDTLNPCGSRGPALRSELASKMEKCLQEQGDDGSKRSGSAASSLWV
jgi:hypothetical protein